jgi:hypothetical protein
LSHSFCADSFRDALVRSGMNLAQSIVLVTLDCVRRGWRYFGWR